MKKIITVLILLIVVFVGCKKDETAPADSQCLLTKYSSVSEEGDNYVVDLEYDNEKKLVSYTLIADNNDKFLLTFQYNSEGNLQSYTEYYNGIKVERTDFSWNGNTLTVTFFDYDSGTWVIDDNKNIFKLNSDGNIIREEYYDMDDNGIWTIRDYSTYEWSNGNILKREYWRKNTNKDVRHPTSPFCYLINDEEIPPFKSVNDDFELYSTTNIIYDTKNNAMLSLKAIPMFWVTNNNGVSSITQYTSGETSSNTATYEYNDTGYPLQSIENYETNNENYHRTINYEYSCD